MASHVNLNTRTEALQTTMQRLRVARSQGRKYEYVNLHFGEIAKTVVVATGKGMLGGALVGGVSGAIGGAVTGAVVGGPVGFIGGAIVGAFVATPTATLLGAASGVVIGAPVGATVGLLIGVGITYSRYSTWLENETNALVKEHLKKFLAEDPSLNALLCGLSGKFISVPIFLAGKFYDKDALYNWVRLNGTIPNTATPLNVNDISINPDEVITWRKVLIQELKNSIPRLEQCQNKDQKFINGLVEISTDIKNAHEREYEKNKASLESKRTQIPDEVDYRTEERKLNKLYFKNR